MQRLLISLSNFIDRFIKKPEPLVQEEEFLLGGNPEGFFLNQTETPLIYYIEEMYDEEADINFRVQFVCACGLPVFMSMSDDFGFGCEHCDSVCRIEGCVNCNNLMKVDFGDPNAHL